MSVACSRRTSTSPASMRHGSAASSSWRWASTPSFGRPGSVPSSWEVSESTSSMVIVSVSPLRVGDDPLPGVLGEPSTAAIIQFSGL